MNNAYRLFSIPLLCLAILFSLPFAGKTEDDRDILIGRVYNDTDIAPTNSGPATLNIVVDNAFMGRIEPGESLVIGLAERIEPYTVKAYVFTFEESSYFAVVDLPLNHFVAVPVSHRGELSPFWVAFEGI